MLTPTLHKPIPLNTRVIIPEDMHVETTPRVGTVVGIASCHVIFTYIVLLDEPLQTSWGEFKAVTVNGPELTGLNGENWRN